jgi:ABC-2 type transport system ATP-binding protein
MEPALEIRSLRKEFGGFTLKDISLTLDKGYIMGFIGPNGAGKSTTIKLILNLLKRDGGEIRVSGKDNKKHEIEVKNKIGFVLDENYYYEELTVNEMKSMVAPFYKFWDDNVFNSYLKRFDLPPRKKIKDLSRGMKMKFALAVALSHHAELLIMDEPTSGLDPVVRSEFLDILSDLIQKDEVAIFFSTHITSDLDKIADYIAFINNGELIMNTTKDDILDNYGLIRGPKELKANEIPGLIGIRENSFGFEALVQDRNKARKMFGDKIAVDKPSLEDIMVYHTRRDKNGQLNL